MTQAAIIKALRAAQKRERHGLRRIARKSGVSIATMYRLMEGKAPRVHTVQRLTDALNGKNRKS